MSTEQIIQGWEDGIEPYNLEESREKNPTDYVPNKCAAQNVFYFVRIKGEYGSFASVGYSKYHRRLSLYNAGYIPRHEVYGVLQCMEHIAELRSHYWGGRYPYRDAHFEIVKEVRTQEIVRSIPKA